MSVCFWDAGNPFTLTASPSCWLAIWTLWIWKTAEERGLKKGRSVSQYSWGSVVSLWLSVGQTLDFSNSLLNGGKEWPVVLWDVQQSSREGRELLLRPCFAGQKLECSWALAEKNHFWMFLSLRGVLKNSSNRPLCHVCMTNDYRDEALTLPSVSYLWGGFGESGQLSPESLISQLQVEETSVVHMCTQASRDLCVCVGTKTYPYQEYKNDLPFCSNEFSFWKICGCSL